MKSLVDVTSSSARKLKVRIIGVLTFLVMATHVFVGAYSIQQAEVQTSSFIAETLHDVAYDGQVLRLQKSTKNFVRALNDSSLLQIGLGVVSRGQTIAHIEISQAYDLFVFENIKQVKIPSGEIVQVTFRYSLLSLFLSALLGLVLVVGLAGWLVTSLATDALRAIYAHADEVSGYVRQLELISLNWPMNRALLAAPKNFDTKEVKELYESTQRFGNIIAQQGDELLQMELVKTRNMMARQIAHDLRSPLTALRLGIKVVTEDNDSEAVGLLKSAISRIEAMAQELVGKEPSVFNQVSSLDAIALSIKKIIAEKRLEFPSVRIEIFAGDSLSGGSAHFEPSALERIVSNLLNNSIEASATFIRLEVSAVRDDLIIVIDDNGRGMSPEILNRVGSEGFTVGKSGGHGLGVYGARVFIESWGGQIHVSSVVGTGTSIKIILKVALI